MKIDAHQHFWKYNREEYPWMGSDKKAIASDHMPSDLKPELDSAGFHGTVAVQARQLRKETDFLLELANRYSWIRGVVGWLDLAAPDLQYQLEVYRQYPALKGLRELIHDMADPRYAESDDHVRGVALLQRYGLRYDLLLRTAHIEPAIALVDRLPGQLFVIDHIAKPDIAAGEFEEWRVRIQEIARRPTVYCKLSGMVTEARWDSWSAADFHRYMDVCLEAFGASRLMIGSDWPVCTLAGSYGGVMQVVEGYVERLSEAEQAAILGGTAVRFYGLGGTGS